MRPHKPEGAAREDHPSLGMPTPPPDSVRTREHARYVFAQSPENSIARGRDGGGTSTTNQEDRHG